MKVIKISKEDREQLIENIQGYFVDERGEEIGELAAGLLLDFFLSEAGPFVYNQGVQDAKRLMFDKMENMGEDLDALQRPIQLHRRY
ncbi:DUF2164 domain-containing protein [Pseudalkalibacillus sp. SCS-8]|uniref:DUF2164 domain-containing protein n=1 Tax=Pseudalkalibacillus nanhaiensis TaxID=3115291 RepID=UPI0032DA42C7